MMALRVLRSLWWKLALTYVVMSLLTTLLAVMAVGPIVDRRDFIFAVQPVNLKDQIVTRLALLQGRTGDRDLVRKTLTDVQIWLSTASAHSTAYSINFSADPKVSVALYRADGARIDVLQTAELAVPERWLPETERLETVSDQERLLVLPVAPAGTLVVRHYAAFNAWKNIRNNLAEFGASFWLWVLLLGLPGSMLGALTATWLTRRLRRIAQATDAWAAGDWRVRVSDSAGDELSDHAETLNRMADKLRAHLDMQQQLATLEERNRLARELHDTVKQQSFAVGLQLHAAQRWLSRDAGKAEHLLASALSLNQSVQADMAAILARIRPSDDLNISLRASLEDMLLPWRTQLAIELQLDANIHFDPRIEIELLRIAGEAMANGVKHAKASQVKLRLQRCEAYSVLARGACDQLTDHHMADHHMPEHHMPEQHMPEHHFQLSIADNGQGFDIDNARSGFGLGTMQERAARLPSGRFEVHSNQQGTEIRVRFFARAVIRPAPLMASSHLEASE